MLTLILLILYIWWSVNVAKDARGNTFIWFCLCMTFSPLICWIANKFIVSIIEG